MDIKYSNDKKVAFYDDTHTYLLEGSTKLKSVTTYIAEFKTPFDKDRISKAYAKKHKLDQEDVLAMWEEKGRVACEMGTFIHSIFEDHILGIPITTDEKYPKCRVAEWFIEDFFKSNRLTPVETELIVYNDNYAGQIDCIAKNEKGEHFILDWKTNKEIKTRNQWQQMTGPYSHLEDHAFNHYSIQLNAYKGLCKEYDIKGCYIVHIGEDEYDLIKALDIEVNL